jgi:hypothetical protein
MFNKNDVLFATCPGDALHHDRSRPTEQWRHSKGRSHDRCKTHASMGEDAAGRQRRFAAVVSSKCCQWLFDLTATDTRSPEVLASSATLIRIDLSCRIDW